MTEDFISKGKTRVLMDAQAFDIQTHGGVSRCFAELVSHMPSDIDLRLPILETKNIYLKQKGIAPDRNYYMEYCKGSPTPLKRFWYKFSTNIRTGHWMQWDRMPRWNLFEAERQLIRGEFDVFHPTYYDTYFLSKIGRKPFVLTVHDMIPERYAGIYNFWNHQLKAKRKLIPLASHIVAVSEHTKKDIIDLFGIAPEKITVIYHGIDQKPYVPIPDQNEFGCYILFVGQRGTYKNFQRFALELSPVLRNHPELSVVCTGEPFSNEESRQLRSIGQQSRFIHKFVQSDEEMMSLYHNALAFVYPSEYEGFGIPILEAYRAGCPVILNRSSCFPEIAGDAAIFFEFNKGGQKLEEKIEDLLSWTPDKKEKFLAIQRERLHLFSWEKAARRLADVYRKVVLEHSSTLQ